MKRFMLWTVLAVVAFAGTAQAQLPSAFIKSTALAKRVQNVTNTDSSTWTLKIASTTAAGDTTAAIDISDMLPGAVPPGGVLTTTFFPLKLVVNMSNDASGPDSLYYKYRVTFDGTNWTQFTTLAGFAGAASANVFAIPISLDSDAGQANPWLAKGIQFVILSDYSAARPNCSASLLYYANR